MDTVWDVFISHATEDKATFVRPLAHALQSKGLKVWFDEFELTIGDSLRRAIDQGLSASKFGVVVLSKHFFAKKWTQIELDALIAKEKQHNKVLLPIWHQISLDEVARFSPILADRFAISSDKGINQVVKEIDRVFKDKGYDQAIRKAHFRQALFHEIKNPLSTIEMYITFLPRIFSDGKKVRRLETLVRHEMSRLVYYTLLIPEISFGEKATTCHIHSIVRKSLSILEPMIKDKKIRTSLLLYARKDSILGVSEKLEFGVFAVLRNAVESMENGRALCIKSAVVYPSSADIRGYLSYKGKECLLISISDKGCGISKSEIDKIFDWGYTTKQNRLGFGLPLARYVFGKVSGHIEIESKASQSTCCKIIIPFN